MKLAELARLLNAELHGDGNLEIVGVGGIEDAAPGQITFVANNRYASHARRTAASAVLVTPDFAEISAATLRIGNPYLAFAKAIGMFYTPPVYSPGVHPTAVIAATATLGLNIHIGAYVVIGDEVVVGDNSILLAHTILYPKVSVGHHFTAHANVVVREGCRIGNNVILQNGVVIGSDGFGFAKDDEGHWHKIPQPGPVILEDDVEVQANTSIDRSSVGETRIGRGAKIDSHVQIGHGCSVGEDTLICAQSGLAGSSHLGKKVVLAGKVGIAGHLTVGDGTVLTANSAISHDVGPGLVLSGSPAFDNRQWLRATAVFSRLPELMRQVQRLTRNEQKPLPLHPTSD